ncbi:MBL fold metallo-hydrolase [Kineococcus siccus]|uniref:MBL fold metallo-hydrolase n=1 Tax=Kineococcus siccus TaxID=2696567 RepID=UPI0030B807FF
MTGPNDSHAMRDVRSAALAPLPTRAHRSHVAYSCTNCGHWQRWFPTAPPPACPVCTDVRNELPEGGFAFRTAAEVDALVTTSWREAVPGVQEFWCDPVVGLGSHGWVLDTADGLLAFEAAPWYSADALAELRRRGGLRVLASSHVHGFGGLWQLQDELDPPVVSVGVADLVWTKAFRVTWPADDQLELAPGIRMHRTGGHFPGHSVLHDADRGLLFCGDSLKIDLAEDGSARALSAHKAFHAQIPLSRAELRHMREVVGSLEFETVFSPFEFAAVTTAHVTALIDHMLAAPPSAAPVPMDVLATPRTVFA